jgi:hypothetical protein
LGIRRGGTVVIRESHDEFNPYLAHQLKMSGQRVQVFGRQVVRARDVGETKTGAGAEGGASTDGERQEVISKKVRLMSAMRCLRVILWFPFTTADYS